jgi:predicted metal-dependent phosphoesterase TrpH
MKADLHIHTNFSDGFSSPQEVVKAAIEKNINCVCITDHHETKGAIEAMRFGFDKDILVIPGIEVTTKLGHILGINIKKIIPAGLSPERTIEEIRRQGGLAIIAHPFDWPIEDFMGGEEKIRALGPDLVGIEVFNAAVFARSSNKTAFDFARKNNFSFTAGSDSHRADFLGRGYLELPDNIQSTEDLLEAIKKKTAEAKGTPLSAWEMLKMVRSNPFTFRSMFKSYKLKAKIEKIKIQISKCKITTQNSK